MTAEDPSMTMSNTMEESKHQINFFKEVVFEANEAVYVKLLKKSATKKFI